MLTRDIPISVAFVGTLLVNVPQLWKTWRTKDVESFSVYTMLMRILINIAWIIFGIMENDVLIIAMSIEVMFCELLLLLFKQMYSTKGQEISVDFELQDVPMAPKNVGTVYRRSFGDNLHVLVASV